MTPRFPPFSPPPLFAPRRGEEGRLDFAAALRLIDKAREATMRTSAERREPAVVRPAALKFLLCHAGLDLGIHDRMRIRTAGRPHELKPTATEDNQ